MSIKIYIHGVLTLLKGKCYIRKRTFAPLYKMILDQGVYFLDIAEVDF